MNREALASPPPPERAAARGGRCHWYVADGYLPPDSAPGFESHECACLLNVRGAETIVRLTFYLEDAAPLGPIGVPVGARRTRHVRLTEPAELEGLVLPRGVPFAYTAESDAPFVLQHSRLDTSGGGYTLATTIAYGE